MDVDFVIPLSKDDLLSGEAGSYVVDEVLSARVLPNKLRGELKMQSLFKFNDRFDVFSSPCVLILILTTLADCLSDLRSNGPTVVVESFDCLFSLLRSDHDSFFLLYCTFLVLWHFLLYLVQFITFYIHNLLCLTLRNPIVK